MRDSDNETLGFIYLDIENRPTKNIGPCHFTVRCSKLVRLLIENHVSVFAPDITMTWLLQLDDGRTFQTPVVVVSVPFASEFQELNQVYLNVQQAENFFHELGHALHSILGRTEYQHVAGLKFKSIFWIAKTFLVATCLFAVKNKTFHITCLVNFDAFEMNIAILLSTSNGWVLIITKCHTCRHKMPNWHGGSTFQLDGVCL